MRNFQLNLVILGAAIIMAINVSAAYAQNPYYQQEPMPPTDTDLKAAYCTAVKVQGVSEVSKAYDDVAKSSETAAPEFKKTLNDSLKKLKDVVIDEKDKLNRLQLYLLPRMKFLDSGGLLAATARAKADQDRAASPEISSCTQQCASTHSKRSQSDTVACVKACAPEIFIRLWSCNDLSWLPF